MPIKFENQIDTSLAQTRSVDIRKMESKFEENKNLTLRELEKTAADFESLFVDLVLKSMRQTVPKEGFIDGGNAEEMYRSLLDSEYAKIMADRRSIGISQSIVKQLKGLLPETQADHVISRYKEADQKI